MRALHCQRIRHDNGDASDNDAGTLWITSMPGDLDMFEYNDLTKELLAQGYDADHHPNYVRLPSSGIHNIYGGIRRDNNSCVICYFFFLATYTKDTKYC